MAVLYLKWVEKNWNNYPTNHNLFPFILSVVTIPIGDFGFFIILAITRRRLA